MPALLDAPFALLATADAALAAALPGGGRLALWAMAGAVLSLEFYRFLSPQATLHALKAQLADAQTSVARFDGEFAEGWPLIRRMLGLALKRLSLILPATLAASVPLLVLILWLALAYGATFPPSGSPVVVSVSAPHTAHWVEGGLAGPQPSVEISDAQDHVVLRAPVAAPVGEVAKWRWWNALVGNPAGYLPDNAPVDALMISLPRQHYLEVGPQWARGWEAVFLPTLLIAALAYKWLRRVE